MIKWQLTLLMYIPWISEMSEASSASSAIGDRREMRGSGALGGGCGEGQRTVACTDAAPFRLYGLYDLYVML